MSKDTGLNTVFVVTSGEYSDYSIDSVWPTREEANRRAATWGQVEEYPFGQIPSRERLYWEAYLDSITEEVLVYSQQKVYSGPMSWVGLADYDINGKKVINGRAFGLTPEAARKALSDALAKFNAEALGL